MLKEEDLRKWLLKGTFLCKTVIMRNFMPGMGKNLRAEEKRAEFRFEFGITHY
jgi:hypothetical protein